MQQFDCLIPTTSVATCLSAILCLVQTQHDRLIVPDDRTLVISSLCYNKLKVTFPLLGILVVEAEISYG